MTVSFPRLVALALAAASVAPRVAAQEPGASQLPPRLNARGPAQAPAGVGAQTPAAPVPFAYDEPNAQQTRERFRQLLRQHPTGLWEVLKYDPALLADPNYLRPYPAVAAFIQAHPEIPRNPRYFVGPPESTDYDVSASGQRIRAVQNMFAGLGFLIGFMTVAGVIAWVIKTAVDYRRWLRLTKVQTEAHTKLVDRFTSSEDLLAYVQTPAGRRFLEAGPVAADAPRSVMAPYGRILWSLQAGTVATLLGAGLLYVSRSLRMDVEMAEAAPFVFMLGVVATAIGLGFVLSAIMSYVVSRRLGLLDNNPASSHA